MQIFEIEDGIPMPERAAAECPYPFAKMHHSQSFIVAARPEHCSKVRNQIVGAYKRWKMRQPFANLGYRCATVEENGVSGVRFWMVEKGVVNDGQK